MKLEKDRIEKPKTIVMDVLIIALPTL